MSKRKEKTAADPLTPASVDSRIGVSDTTLIEVDMGKGSERVTVRIGEEMRMLIEEEIAAMNAHPMARREWTVTEFIVQAVAEKLSHRHRSRGSNIRVTAEKTGDFGERSVDEIETKQ